LNQRPLKPKTLLFKAFLNIVVQSFEENRGLPPEGLKPSPE